MTDVIFKYPCGIEMKCKYSGFVGVAMSRVELLNGCVQYDIQPKVVNNKQDDGWWIDEQNLVPTGKKKKYSEDVVYFEFDVGDELVSVISGHKGICTHRRIDLNGCQHYGIETKLNKDGKRNLKWCTAEEVKKKSSGLNKKSPVVKQKTGCRSIRSREFGS